MGVVYKARDQKLGRVVAIKTIAAVHHATRAQLERFRAEAEAVARLKHPNVIPIYTIGEHQGGRITRSNTPTAEASRNDWPTARWRPLEPPS